MSEKVCAGDGSDRGQDVEVEASESAWFASVVKNGEVSWEKSMKKIQTVFVPRQVISKTQGMTESASILNGFRSSSPDLEIVWIASHPPSSRSHRNTGRCAVDSLSLVAAGGVGYVGLRKHLIVGVSWPPPTHQIHVVWQATTCTDRNDYGKLATGDHRLIKHSPCGKELWQGTCMAGSHQFY